MKINPALQSMQNLSPNKVREQFYDKTVEGVGNASESRSFTEMLSQSIQSVNETQLSADEAVTKLLSGDSGAGMHETMLALEEADLKMRLMVQVRNKAVDAYREIMRITS